MGGGATSSGRGLEGVVATTSAISSIVGSRLTYRGIAIDELVENSTFEEVAYLLWYGELPTREGLADFCRQLSQHRDLPGDVLDQLRNGSPDASAMGTLRTAMSLLATSDPRADVGSSEANGEIAVRLLAAFPTVVATIARFRAGLDPVAPDPDLDEAANFLYMVRGRRPERSHAQIMDQVLVLHADHELNASTFAARVAASTLADLYSAVIAGICTLTGPLHGGATEAVQRMLRGIESVDDVPGWVRGTLERGERVMGFGHRVYKEGDPRAHRLKRMAAELAEETGERRWYDVSVRIEEEMRAKRRLLPNVDFYSASVYTYLDIPAPLFTPIFAMSRVAGWIAHVLEQYSDNRLIRPRAEYIGPSPRPFVRVEAR
jgi:citrate synthase